MRIGTRLLASFLLLAGWSACDRPTPVAPSESTLTITANPLRIPVDGTALISVLARKSDGTAVNPGTEIYFSTTLGAVDPLVTTDDRGVAEATLTGDGRIGMALVTAESGAAGQADVEIQIGALASSITLTATPDSLDKDLPPGGAEVSLIAVVTDDLANAVIGIPVTFSSDIGTMASPGPVDTDVDGIALNTLTVTELGNVEDGEFEVTASTAGETGEVTDSAFIEVGGFALNINLDVDPTSIPSSGGQVRLTALVLDDFGDPLEDVGVFFNKDAGSLASGGALVQTDANGQAFDTLTVTQADLAALGAAATLFNVSAEVPGAGGELISSGNFPIRIQPEPPIADFGFSALGLTVTFSNASTGDLPITWAWDFGDGDSSPLQNPSHAYAVAGTYFVTLRAINDGGESSITKEVSVVDPVVPTPQLGVDVKFNLNKSVFADPIDWVAGDTLRFEIVATNTGSADLSAVTVGSTLSPAPTCLPAVPVTLLQPGESIVCEQDYVLTSTDDSSGSVTNLVQADSPTAIQVADSVTVTVP